MSNKPQIEDESGDKYKFGFITDIAADVAPKGLSEDIIRLISKKKNEPDWLLDSRLRAYRHWLTMIEPTWAKVTYDKIDYQDLYYYSAPKQIVKPKSLDEVDPKILETYNKLGIPLKEQEALAGVVAVDAVFDSVSVATTYKAQLKKQGIIFCSISEAVKDYPDLVKQYLGSVVPYTDNFFAALNSAVFTDGSFVYIPKGVKCPMELSTYFRINAQNTGQFERTLIVADEESYVSYLEGCTAPQRDENQLHAAIVEIVVKKDAEVKYSTVQNWYPGDKDGKGGVYNFVTKRALCDGENAKVSWTQVETGSAVTWKYPSCVLKGDNSKGEFYSVALTNNHQQADTGTKMIHLGKNTTSRIISKGISAGFSDQTYRGLVKVGKNATGARNYSQCDSLLIGQTCGSHTVPYIENACKSAILEHEATTSKIREYTEDSEFNDEDLKKRKNDYLNLYVEIALDDYGSGYSNVNNLIRYNPRYVKIDHGLIRGINSNSQKRHFVKNIVSYASKSNISVLAEGVETEEELRTVIGIGVNLIQGFYTGRPEKEAVQKIDDEIRSKIRRFSYGTASSLIPGEEQQ